MRMRVIAVRTASAAWARGIRLAERREIAGERFVLAEKRLLLELFDLSGASLSIRTKAAAFGSYR